MIWSHEIATQRFWQELGCLHLFKFSFMDWTNNFCPNPAIWGMTFLGDYSVAVRNEENSTQNVSPGTISVFACWKQNNRGEYLSQHGRQRDSNQRASPVSIRNSRQYRLEHGNWVVQFLSCWGILRLERLNAAKVTRVRNSIRYHPQMWEMIH